MAILVRSLVAVAALLVSILAAGPVVVDAINKLLKRAWYVFAAEVAVTVVLWLSLLLLLRVI